MTPYYAVNAFETLALQIQFEAVISQRTETGHWLALIDTAFDHGKKTAPWPTTVWPIYHQGRLALMKSVSPVLLALPSADDAGFEKIISRLLNHCRGRPMLSFLHSNKPPQALCESWQSVLEIETESGQPFVLRFADTRTTPTIAAVLSSDVWARLSHGIEDWLCIDREGSLQALLLPDTQGQGPLAGETQEIVRISNHALAQLLKLGQPDALADALQEHFPELLVAGQGALTHQRLSAACEVAEKNDIEAFPDLMALAVAICSTDGQLLEDPDFKNWLQQRQWESEGLVNALSEYLEPSKASES